MYGNSEQSIFANGPIGYGAVLSHEASALQVASKIMKIVAAYIRHEARKTTIDGALRSKAAVAWLKSR